MPFELTNPKGLWLLGLLVPLVVLYLLKVRRHPVPVPSTWLWQTAQRDLLARNPFRRFHRELSLLIQALAVVSLSLAAARPALRSAVGTAEHVAFVIDTSASMGASLEDGTPRIERAKEKARALVLALGAETDALVIDAARQPRLAVPLDRDKRRIASGIASLSARHEEGRLERSIALAVERLERLGGERRVFVLTDDGGAVASPASVPVEVFRFGEPQDNVGITRFDVRRSNAPAVAEARVEAFVTVENFGRSPVERFVTLRQHNTTAPLASRRIHLEPRARVPVVLSFPPSPTDAGTGLVLELSPADALASDDRAFGVVPHGSELEVVLASDRPSPWLTRAFEADPDVVLRTAVPDDVAGGGIEGDLFVFDGTCPERVPSGDFWVVNPKPGPCLGTQIGDLLEGPVLTSWAEEDPRLRFVSFEDVTIGKARPIEGVPDSSALLRAGDAVLSTSLNLFGSHGTLLAFDPAESDFPLKAAFVLFTRNVADLARSSRAAKGASQADSGVPLRIRVPPAVSRVTLAAPDGTRRELEAHRGIAIAPPPSLAGFHFASWTGADAGSALFAVNLQSEVESNLLDRETHEPTPATPVASSATGTTTPIGSIAWLVALGGLGLLLLDVGYSTRRPRRRREGPSIAAGRGSGRTAA